MAFKSLLFVSLLAALMATHVAHAQILPPLLSLIRIDGVVSCAANATVGTNLPPFPNAQVLLQCGGNTLANVTTNALGRFTIFVDPIQTALSVLLNSCNLVVRTPLAACNANLPSVGGLVSRLQSITSNLLGNLNIFSLVPVGFLFQNILP